MQIRAPFAPPFSPPFASRFSVRPWIILAITLSASNFLSCSHGNRVRPGFELAEKTASVAGHDVETIAILGTNDIHGTLLPQELKTRETESAPIPYTAGGLSVLASYVRVMRAEYGPRFLWLDAGDEFQGSLESNSEQGAPMVASFNLMGLHAAAVGNHEFDFALPALQARVKEAQYPYLAANIFESHAGESTKKLATDSLPGLKSHQIFQVGTLKVGVIGLSTLDTPRTTRPDQIRSLAFGDLKEATLKGAQDLRKDGAQIVLIVAHAGLKCERGRSPVSSHLRKPSDPQGECGPDDEMVRLLKSLPLGTVDAVVAGHSHQIVHHWVAGVPVIQGGAFGRYLNVIYLNYDKTEGKLLTDLSRIEGPVPVCPGVFQNQGDCNGERPAPRTGRGAWVPTRFHGETITPDAGVDQLVQPVVVRTTARKGEVLAQLARPAEHERFKESPLGNFVADSIREAAGADVAIMNSGGVRAPWDPGALTYGAVFRTLPFDNAVQKITLSGRELKTILRIADSGSRGFFSVSGAQLRLIDPDSDAPSTDLDGNHEIDSWETNRLLEAKLLDQETGKTRAIQDDKDYTLATIDFLILGGDDLGWAMARIPASRISAPIGVMRDAVVAHIKKLAALGPLNSEERPFYDSKSPRLKFEKTGKKGRRGGGHRRKRRH